MTQRHRAPTPKVESYKFSWLEEFPGKPDDSRCAGLRRINHTMSLPHTNPSFVGFLVRIWDIPAGGGRVAEVPVEVNVHHR